MKNALDKPIDVQRGNVCVEQMMCARMLGMEAKGNGITRDVHLGNALMHNHCSWKNHLFSIFQKLLKRFSWRKRQMSTEPYYGSYNHQ